MQQWLCLQQGDGPSIGLKQEWPRASFGAVSSGGSNGDPFKGGQGDRRPLRLGRLRLEKQKEQSPEASSLFQLPRQAEAGRRAQPSAREVPHCLRGVCGGLLNPGSAWFPSPQLWVVTNIDRVLAEPCFPLSLPRLVHDSDWVFSRTSRRQPNSVLDLFICQNVLQGAGQTRM